MASHLRSALIAAFLVAALPACASAPDADVEESESADALSTKPSLTIATGAEAPPGTKFDLRFDSRAPDGSRARVTASPMPPGAAIFETPEGFQFSWKPEASDVGEHVLVFTARVGSKKTRRTVRLVVREDAVSTAMPLNTLNHHASGLLSGQVRLTNFGFVKNIEAPLSCTLVGENPGAAKAKCTITIDQYTFDTRTSGWTWEGPWTITKEANVDRVTGAFHLYYDEAAGRSYRLDGRFGARAGGGHQLRVDVAYSLSWRLPYGGTAAAIHELEGTVPLEQ